jgi:hypothetical protein
MQHEGGSPAPQGSQRVRGPVPPAQPPPTVGGKFAVGAADGDGKLVGVAIAVRPICRRLDDGLTLEVLRVCTDGTANACPLLYARCAKIGRLMGYERIITYTLAWESGASLRAVGATPTGPLDFHD